MMKKSERQANINFEFLREAKKKTIHTLMCYGKKHPVLKYPIFVATVLFIFVYNVFLHLFIQLHMREKLARGLAMAMSILLVLTSIDITAFAMSDKTAQETAVTVVGFAELPEEIRQQELAVGASEEEIQFPDKLTVTALNETAAPAASSTPTPEATGTPTPEVTETPVPEETETPVPEETETPVPEETETPVPEVTETPVPEVTEAPVPEVTETPAPEATETPAPEATE
ncbi:MAG: hypothetical protein ACI4AB_02160, partial [Acetatifactor sp.]